MEKEVVKNSDNREITISLIDDDKKEYSSSKLEHFSEFTNNIDKYKDNISVINIVILNERIDNNILTLINNFYKETKGAFKTNLIVKHTRKYNISEDKVWNIETIIKANNYINKMCETIKDNNLSPAETLAYIHLKLQMISKYSPSIDCNWCSNDQFFAGAFMEKPEYVCAGCVSLFKKIVDTLDDPCLKCDMVALTAYNLDKRETEEHARIRLKLKDLKYNIDDEFYDDPTWDYARDGVIKYGHLFMTSDCHKENLSKYDFYNFGVRIIDESSKHSYIDYYTNDELKVQNVKPLDQKLVEKIVFKALTCIENKEFDDVYNDMKEMALASYGEQQYKRYKSTLTSKELCISKQEAKSIYDSNVKKVKRR